ncbi:MAG TPA: MBL fold metallo-hydrolase [Bdellovibrio sp.]|uniref:MBL fold metallo-hydrolase n=1 Tax=Bdellovibrio sp. TaxID=28201 RepID=UPI002F196210
MELSFLGGAGTVTGSKFLLSHNGEQILIDCGMFQGLKQFRLLNWDKIDVDTKQLKAIILTHAHLDHCGALPLIVRQGFRGPIFCTSPTKEIAKIVLLDAAKIQMEEADYANKKRFSKHSPAKPLFDLDDVEKVFPLFKSLELYRKTEIGEFQATARLGGHILGATSILISADNKHILFSGDLGRYNDPTMPPPDPPGDVSHLIIESTYGDRLHSSESSSEILTELIVDTWKRKSILLIPAFALGRSQNLIYEIHKLKQQGQIPKEIPVYFNSPMGQEICALYGEFLPDQNGLQKDFKESLKEIHFIGSAEDSKKLNQTTESCVIIASSGMLTGGRVLHHIKAFGDNPQNTILLPGFQSAGTRGWSLVNGQKKIKIHGSYMDVKARLLNSDSFSAHADQEELVKWVSLMPKPPKQTFIVHGEPSASDELRKALQEKLKISAVIPILNSSYEVL